MGGKAAFAGLAISLVLGTFSQARAETFVEHNAEFRMQLDFVVPDGALRKFLPSGWEPNIATQGPAKDRNLRMIFIDRVDITGADGAPARLVLVDSAEPLLEECPVDRPRQLHQRVARVDDRIEPRAQKIGLPGVASFPWSHRLLPHGDGITVRDSTESSK